MTKMRDKSSNKRIGYKEFRRPRSDKVAYKEEVFTIYTLSTGFHMGHLWKKLSMTIDAMNLKQAKNTVARKGFEQQQFDID